MDKAVEEELRKEGYHSPSECPKRPDGCKHCLVPLSRKKSTEAITASVTFNIKQDGTVEKETSGKETEDWLEKYLKTQLKEGENDWMYMIEQIVNSPLLVSTVIDQVTQGMAGLKKEVIDDEEIEERLKEFPKDKFAQIEEGIEMDSPAKAILFYGALINLEASIFVKWLSAKLVLQNIPETTDSRIKDVATKYMEYFDETVRPIIDEDTEDDKTPVDRMYQ